LDQETNRERVNQKARTRSALIDSAATLIRAGRRPTVEDAAKAVGISKRTAYRYFVSQEHLLADAALESLRPSMNEILLAVSTPDNAHARIAILAVALRRLGEEHESELREMMRASLDRNAQAAEPGTPRTRGNRRLDWIRMSLEPVRADLPAEAFTNLTNCLAVCLGIDALIVLRDICGITGQEAENLMVWMAKGLLDRTLAEVKFNK
jgi:AcrR family transcriptional regulator